MRKTSARVITAKRVKRLEVIFYDGLHGAQKLGLTAGIDRRWSFRVVQGRSELTSGGSPE